jgi:tRNA threonylcarbamoyl adenosine modification protein (Sua5/YciO/YrdC/YwlC family)
MTLRIECADGRERVRAVTAAIAALRRGDLVILPTENTYVLATDAFSPRGVRALRQAKGHAEETPLGLLVPRAGTVPGIAADVSFTARTLMAAFWPGMVTLLLDAQPTLAWDHPQGSPVAVRAPAHPVALGVVTEAGPTAASGITDAGDPVRSCELAMQIHPDAAIALDAGVLDAPWSDSEDPELASTIIDVRGDSAVIMRHGAVSEERIRAALAATS